MNYYRKQANASKKPADFSLRLLLLLLTPCLLLLYAIASYCTRRLWPPCALSVSVACDGVGPYIWPPEDLGDVPQDFESQFLTSSSTIMGDSNCPIFTSATQSIRDGRPQTALQSTAPSNLKQHKRSVIAQDLQTCDAY